MGNAKHLDKKDWYITNGYEFSGLFYKAHDGTPCRRVLDIRKNGCKIKNPDLMVIMMNPGGSYPKGDREFENVQVVEDIIKLKDELFLPTIPDATQWKVVDFMVSKGYQYARVLNLSDMCESNLKKTDIEIFSKNSIFVNEQFEYLKEYFRVERNKPVLMAWGTDKYNIYAEIAEKAFNYLKDEKVELFGYWKQSTNYFYHPKIRPNRLNKLTNWLDSIAIIK